MRAVCDQYIFVIGVPVKQRVGPMIKGYPITKPKIMLKRISVPLQQVIGKSIFQLVHK